MVAVVVARDGRLPGGADAAAAEAGGAVVVVGSGAEAGAHSLLGARLAFWAETGPGLHPARLAATVAGAVQTVPVVVMPSSPDGRDLAPRLAATLGRPLVAGAVEVCCDRPDGSDGEPNGGGQDDGVVIRATVARLDDRVLVPVKVAGPAVVTLQRGPSIDLPAGSAPRVEPLLLPGDRHAPSAGPAPPDPEILAVLEPDVHTMDLTEAVRVVAGGAGLAAGGDDRQAKARFELLGSVAAAMGAAAGATRVATDAGWAAYDRQIGTTGVAINPELYVAFGVSGATQHVGGLGSPRHVISVNTDGACPMTLMADLGLITDASALLAELAGRFEVASTRGAGDRTVVHDD
jgi:electron transfer flavoprotein alpha subunit